MKQKIALVLGSGGARGTAHIGVIREILSRGYDISSISGTSMGALVGGVYASGKLDEYEEWLCQLDRMDVFKLVDFTLSKNGIIKADKVLKEIKKFIPDQNIEDLSIPYAAVATDVKNLSEMVFESGSLWNAIRASIAIPMVLTPAKIEELHYVDGGVLNPVPVNRVKRTKGDLLVAVNVNAQTPSQIVQKEEKTNAIATNKHLQIFIDKMAKIFPKNPKNDIGYFQLVNDTTNMMLSQISKLTLEQSPPDLLINISGESCGTYDFHKAKELIELGRMNTAQCLDSFE